MEDLVEKTNTEDTGLVSEDGIQVVDDQLEEKCVEVVDDSTDSSEMEVVEDDTAVPEMEIVDGDTAVSEIEVVDDSTEIADSKIDSTLKKKRKRAHSVVAAATVASAVVGAVPIPIPDSAILMPTEIAMINSIGKTYDLYSQEGYKDMTNRLVDAGLVSAAAKLALKGLKAIPGINLAASVLNAIVAATFVAALGEATIYIFEQIHTGKKTMEDVDWVNKVLKLKVTAQVAQKVKGVVPMIKNGDSAKDIAKAIAESFKK